jgi:hypothetical protein
MPPNEPVEVLPVSEPTSFRKRIILGVLGAVVLLAVGGMWWWFVGRDAATMFPKDATVMVSLGFVPASPLVLLNAERTGFAPHTLAPELSEKLVIDRVVTKKGEYLLVLDPVTSVANVMLRTKEGEALVAVTDSATMKFDLSYDEKSDTVVYLSKKLSAPEEFLQTRDWDVTTFSAGTEKVVGTGLHAEVVPGKGAVIVGTYGGALSWIPVSEGSPVSLMEREQAWTFAVRPNGKELAVYNPTLNQIDRIDISQGPENVRTVESLNISGRPASLTYLKDKVVVALPDRAQSKTTFMIAGNGAHTLEVQNLYPDVPSAAYNLTIEL